VFELPRGTRDFLPEEMQKRRFIEKKLRFVFESYGYHEIQTPTFENLELFTAKSGEGIINELYSFTDKGNRELALRPELTAPVMRLYVENLQMKAKPLKLFYFGNCYRYDRPQKGRYREFTQAGCELIGTDSSEAIAELISMAYQLLHKLSLQNITLEIGNLRLLSLLFNYLGLNDDQRSQLIPLIDKDEYEEVRSLLDSFALDDTKTQWFLDVLQIQDINILTTALSSVKEVSEHLTRMQEICSFLDIHLDDFPYRINLGIVRGLDYYTGVVFEMKAPSLGAEKQILGGGEYDLISLFGGRALPTAGFALGFDRTLLAMDEEHILFPQSSLDYYVIPITSEMREQAFKVCRILRNQGFLVDVDLMRRGIGKSLKYANNQNARFALLIGPDEFEKGFLILRDMQQGTQEELTYKELSSLRKIPK